MHEKSSNAVERGAEPHNEAEPSALDKLIRIVAEDARLDPEAYIQESIVPEGGE